LARTAERAGPVKATAGLATVTAMGVLAAMIGYDESDKDKDGKSKYTKIPNYRKDTLMLFKEGSYGVPIPQEIAPFYVMGNAIAEAAMGGTEATHAASRIVTSFMNNYIPANIPQQEIAGYKANAAEFLMRSLLPSQALPLADLGTGRNTFGGEIVSGLDKKLAQGIPKSEMGDPTENQLAANLKKNGLLSGGVGDLATAAPTLIAQGLGDLGINMAPQQIKLLNNYFDPAAEGFAFWRDILGGREEKYQGDIVNPLERKITGKASSFYDQDQFEELLARATQAKYLATKNGIATLSPEDQALARSAAMLAKVDSDADNLFKGNKLLTPERRKLLNERKQELILNGIRRYNDERNRTGAR
jgi:hypothetical protein